MLDAVAELITEKDSDETSEVDELPKFSIIGQPNVGKSSLLNALVGKERTIVSDIAGTTRDTIHTHYKLFDKDFVLIDTAGIRRKAKVHEDLEFYSVIRAIKAVDEADVCMLLLDAGKGIVAQDLSIFSMAVKKGKGIVILVYENRKRKVATSKLNDIMLKAIEKFNPPVVRGNAIKIKYVTQLPTYTPSFAFFCNYPNDIKTPYKNYLENKLRENFDFSGVPIRLFFRKK